MLENRSFMPPSRSLDIKDFACDLKAAIQNSYEFDFEKDSEIAREGQESQKIKVDNKSKEILVPLIKYISDSFASNESNIINGIMRIMSEKWLDLIGLDESEFGKPLPSADMFKKSGVVVAEGLWIMVCDIVKDIDEFKGQASEDVLKKIIREHNKMHSSEKPVEFSRDKLREMASGVKRVSKDFFKNNTFREIHKSDIRIEELRESFIASGINIGADNVAQLSKGEMIALLKGQLHETVASNEEYQNKHLYDIVRGKGPEGIANLIDGPSAHGLQPHITSLDGRTAVNILAEMEERNRRGSLASQRVSGHSGEPGNNDREVSSGSVAPRRSFLTSEEFRTFSFQDIVDLANIEQLRIEIKARSLWDWQPLERMSYVSRLRNNFRTHGITDAEVDSINEKPPLAGIIKGLTLREVRNRDGSFKNENQIKQMLERKERGHSLMGCLPRR